MERPVSAHFVTKPIDAGFPRKNQYCDISISFGAVAAENVCALAASNKKSLADQA
jgi:hypothetical protein